MNDTNYAADFVDLFLKGVERAGELQKKALEAATQQTTEAIAASKKAIQPAMSGMSDVVQQGFDRYVEAQKSVIDLVVQQTAAMIETARQSGSSGHKVLEDFTKSVQQSVERAVEIQKKALGLATHSASKARGGTRHKV
jgi:flagellar hook-basal body complex protein FliE